MKRFFQFVAFAVAVVLCGQSALAGVPCPGWLNEAGSHSSGCCLSAQDTAPAQLMAGCHGSVAAPSKGLGYSQNSCQMAAFQGPGNAITSSKFGMREAVAVDARVQAKDRQLSIDQAYLIETRPNPGPARYLLFQNFRI